MFKLRIYSRNNEQKISMQTHTAEILKTLHGKDGTDYILTEEDKKEIAHQAAKMVDIPDIPENIEDIATIYWVSENYQPKGNYAAKSDIPSSLPASDVYSWAKQASKPTYSKVEVGLGNVDNVKQYSASNPPPYPVTSVNGQTGAVEVEPKGISTQKTSEHNTSEEAHSDIRLMLANLVTKVNDLLDSDDTTLDQMSEVVAYIKDNRELLESVTTNKVNVADIIDNLTTSVSNKPLSAKQGVQLKALIDAIKVPTKLSELSGDSTHRTVTDSEKSTWNAKSNFSGSYNDLSNKPTIPTVPTNISAFNNDAGYMKTSELTTENWTFTLKSGSIVTKAVVVK